ncbi:hypothetical protein GCM10009087_15330 [Sphingomonas oligophenolica]|uniref:Tetratricopeptide repeat protein n=1 Tax=Sphingomonas oligophenolica TaxID=301154 RepID=A0ABU9YBX5_9SPHN
MTTSPAGIFRTIGFKLLGAATVLGGGALILSGALDASVSDGHPDGLGGFAKGSVAAMHHRLVSDLALEKGATIPLRDLPIATALLSKSPLDPVAQTYLGLAAQAKGDVAAAHSLMELAVRSDGRAVRPRIWLIDQSLRRRDFSAAVEHLDRLIMTNPDRRQVTIKAMSSIVRDPASRAPLARMLATNPSWRQEFLYELNQQGMSPDAIFGLTTRNSAKTEAIFEQSSLLQTLLKNHEYERAYLAWINFLPESSLKQVGIIYDPGFADLPGPAPFNWQLVSGPNGSAEFSRPKGLAVTYLGATPTMLAQQTLLLSPGRYRFSVVASGSDEYNQLAWTITCAGGGEPVQTTKLANLADRQRRYSTIFEIPASGCEAQQLALAGSPGEFPKTATAAIDTVLIEAAE